LRKKMKKDKKKAIGGVTKECRAGREFPANELEKGRTRGPAPTVKKKKGDLLRRREVLSKGRELRDQETASYSARRGEV